LWAYRARAASVRAQRAFPRAGRHAGRAVDAHPAPQLPGSHQCGRYHRRPARTLEASVGTSARGQLFRPHARDGTPLSGGRAWLPGLRRAPPPSRAHGRLRRLVGRPQGQPGHSVGRQRGRQSERFPHPCCRRLPLHHTLRAGGRQGARTVARHHRRATPPSRRARQRAGKRCGFGCRDRAGGGRRLPVDRKRVRRWAAVARELHHRRGNHRARSLAARCDSRPLRRQPVCRARRDTEIVGARRAVLPCLDRAAASGSAAWGALHQRGGSRRVRPPSDGAPRPGGRRGDALPREAKQTGRPKPPRADQPASRDCYFAR
jgi:hypothetical protein